MTDFLGTDIAIDPEMSREDLVDALRSETDGAITALLNDLAKHLDRPDINRDASLCREAADRVAEYRIRKTATRIGWFLLGALTALMIWTAFSAVSGSQAAKKTDRLAMEVVR